MVTWFFSQRGGASGGDLVLVRESAENLFSADPVLGEVDLRWPAVSWPRARWGRAVL
jgi:hypothetical protein